MAWINVDYDFYTNTFKGTVIPESAFDRKSVESEAFINKITFGRIHKYDLRPDDLKAVKLSICATAEAVYNLDKHRILNPRITMDIPSLMWTAARVQDAYG